MPAPPPPPPPTFCAPSASQDDRGMLLRSIRAGKPLKKTVTIDKSAPAIGGRVKEECSSSGGPAYRGNTGGGGAPNLGGLFTGGMPKLKATGLRSNIVDKDGGASNATGLGPAPKRGPPPVPPPATQKPQVLPEAPEPVIPKGFGKPMLAPKPPPLGGGAATVAVAVAVAAVPPKPSPPPKKLNLLSGPSVSRAQSMRLPRSPPVLAPTPSSLHQSQDCLNETQHRPIINRALRPPIARPPSPPTSKTCRDSSMATTTRVAPPPPSRLAVTAPSMPPPPPPPPYRSTSMHQRLAPPPPPTPPTRVASSSRNGQITVPTMMNLDLELRFADKFHSIMNFPNPSTFRGFPKVYNSKNAAKQQAPAPPLQPTSAPGTMLRLNASSGGKQWQDNAASSAC